MQSCSHICTRKRTHAHAHTHTHTYLHILLLFYRSRWCFVSTVRRHYILYPDLAWIMLLVRQTHVSKANARLIVLYIYIYIYMLTYPHHTSLRRTSLRHFDRNWGLTVIYRGSGRNGEWTQTGFVLYAFVCVCVCVCVCEYVCLCVGEYVSSTYVLACE